MKVKMIFLLNLITIVLPTYGCEVEKEIISSLENSELFLP